MNDSIIDITESAVQHLKDIVKSKNQEKLYIRIGIKQGGCSGLSYFMDYENIFNIKDNDLTFDYDQFTLICDNKSVLYLYGIVLDYSSSLIDGGFKFINPNAKQTCGCGKSFA
uniref:Iron-sulfur cluster assembly accessory protein n=1 Tax=Galdieria phlegrea TaxID=1389228 RepID=UPI0023D85B02|nr:Iron-sulfur cluster assembly accessory protein [Galdieria phlegrea]WDA99818.1 Iron-sulfur cluster assembly accessory protein [Galdieria phlegrea]